MMSARTSTVVTRLRRLRIGSSITAWKCPTWASGTAVPALLVRVMLLRLPRFFALAALGAGNHGHGAVAFAHFGDRVAAEQGVELGLDLVGGEAQQAQAVLIEYQAVTAGALAPIEEGVLGQCVSGDDFAHVF